MSAVAMPVSRRRARPVLRSVPTGPGARTPRPAGGVRRAVPGGPYVDGSLAGIAGIGDWLEGAGGRRDADGFDAVPVHARRRALSARTPGLRLTQRGRLTRTLACFGVLCLLVSLAFARLTAPGALVADHATTVQPGQTLSDIARAELPARPVEEGVQMLRELNAMNSTVVVAGQDLLVPAP